MSSGEFYVGYLPKAPASLSRFLRKLVLALAIVAVGMAVVLVSAQSRFAFAGFEFNRIRDFEGTIYEHPYPTLYVQRPATNSLSAYPLVAPGKHGAHDVVSGFDASYVRLRGKLIFRREGTMIEVVPGTVERNPEKAAAHVGLVAATERVALIGEIVDSKCFLGVMNPGKGKVHRDCAVRCISGGAPPALLTKGADGQSTILLIADAGGYPIAPQKILDKIAEPVRVTGRLAWRGSQRLLLVDQIDPI